jgi:hypothetical protein
MTQISFKSGIYEITNAVNGRRYVGSSIDLDRRKRDHFSSLKRNKHGNPYLQNDFNKCGAGAFRFSVLETCEIWLLLEKEQTLLDACWDNKKTCYNIRKKAQLCSDEAKAILGKEFSGNKNPNFGKHGADSPLSKVVYQFDKTLKLLNKFHGSVEAQENTGVSKTSINRCCNGHLQSAGGFLWSFDEAVKPRAKITTRKRYPRRHPALYLLSPDDETVEVSNLVDFCKEKKLNYSSINYVLKSKRNSCFGWRKV